MPNRRPREFARPETLSKMDRALTLVSGSFVAAAKLLDMTPQRFRNIVNSNACLKTQWGHSKRGRPATTLNFYIEPYGDEPWPRPKPEPPTPGGTGFEHSLRIRAAILALPAADRIELAEWFEKSKEVNPAAWRADDDERKENSTGTGLETRSIFGPRARVFEKLDPASLESGCK
jgi:hypothetical protein